LSWIQAELLPTLSDNVVGAIREMSGNLMEFNKAFSDNTSNLGTALSKVNESYKLQIELVDAVNKIQESRTATANLQLFTKLTDSSEQLEKLAEYLRNTGDYLNNVRVLNEKLDLQENRTRIIEEMGLFFKTELKQIEARKGTISKAVGTVDDYLKQALEKLKDNADSQFVALQNSTIRQQDFFKSKAEEISVIASEINNLTKALESMKKLENATNEQNRKIDRLANSIESLAQAKSSGVVQIQQKTPIWQIVLIGVIALSSTALAINSFIKSEPKTEKMEIIQSQPVIQQPVVPAATTDPIEIEEADTVTAED
jgi:hypothetical protein